jgi:FPC/CPF motif-containing protein YcgG
MTQEATKSAAMLNFPIQIAQDLSGCFDTDVLYFQTKLAIIQTLNAISAGEREMTESIRQSVYDFNQLCWELGYLPLSTDF